MLFAWYTSEGGAERWLNGWKDGDIDYYDQYETPPSTPTNIVRFWTNNGGYHQIQNKIAKAKVFYGSEWEWFYDDYYGTLKWSNLKDHSAIVDSNTDYFISKWGKLPRYRHKPADCPYVGSGLSLSYYYIDDPIISSIASSSLCDNVQRTYSEIDFSDIDLEYDWNYTSPLAEVSDDDESIYIVEGTSQSGQGTVSLTVITPSGATTFDSENVWVGGPQHDLYAVYSECGDGGPVGYSCPFWVAPFYSGDSVVWEVYPAADITDHGNGIANITFNSPGNYTIWAYTANECDDGNPVYTYFYAYQMLMSPNPAYDEVEITIDYGETEDLKSASLAKQEYVVTISDIYGITKSQKNYSGNKFTVPVQHLKEGNYIVRLSNSKISLSKQLIIKR